jgi:Family of unknown function (DUF6010)
MHSSPPLLVMDYVGPALGAVIFVLVMSLVKEPSRRTFNAIFVAGASGVYLSGGFGPWELLYPAITTPIVYLGLRSYRFIGLAWLMHSCWDIAHHLWGNPIWPFMPSSSFGCMIFDAEASEPTRNIDEVGDSNAVGRRTMSRSTEYPAEGADSVFRSA